MECEEFCHLFSSTFLKIWTWEHCEHLIWIKGAVKTVRHEPFGQTAVLLAPVCLLASTGKQTVKVKPSSRYLLLNWTFPLKLKPEPRHDSFFPLMDTALCLSGWWTAGGTAFNFSMTMCNISLSHYSYFYIHKGMICDLLAKLWHGGLQKSSDEYLAESRHLRALG